MRSVFLVLLVGAFLSGCGGKQAEQSQDEQTKVVEKTVVKTVEETVKETIEAKPETTSGYVPLDPEEQRQADAAKAAAVEEEITLETLNKLDDTKDYDWQIISGLLNCQLEQYASDYGEQAAQEFVDKEFEELMTVPEGEEVVSLQERFLEMGYSCTIPEALSY